MKIKLDKATFRDLEHQASELGLGWMSDRDESYIYFTKWCYCDVEDRGYDSTVRYQYTWSDGKLSVDKTSATTVLRNTDYVEDVTEVEKELSVIKSLLNKLLGKSDIIKQFNDKKFTVIEPLYTPFGKIDGHGDSYKDENGPYELVKAFEEHREGLQKAINHVHKTDCFDIVKAWVNEKETELGGEVVQALQPLVEVRYTEKAYELRKAGKLKGPSIGCSAWTEDVIKGLKDELKQHPKRFLSKFDFSEKRHHLSLTTESVGGPASGEDWYIDMNKSLLAPEDLAMIEEDLGEEFKELEKKHLQDSLDNQKAPSTSEVEAQDAGVDNKTLNKGKDDNMSDNITKAEFEALQVELAKMKAEAKKNEVEKSLAKYGLEDEVLTGLAGALVTTEDYSPITKALDVLVARVVEAETQAKEDVEKASAKTPETKLTSDIEKAMGEEEGVAPDEMLQASDELSEDKLKELRKHAAQNV